MTDPQTLRAEFEKTYSLRVQQMQKFFEIQFLTLKQSIQSVYARILKDELFQTMRRDSITSEYLLDRVKQLFEEIVGGDREAMIERLGHELDEIRAEAVNYQNQIKKQKNELEILALALSKQKEINEHLSKNLVQTQSLLDAANSTRRSEGEVMITEKESQLRELKTEVKKAKEQIELYRINLKDKESEIKEWSIKSKELEEDNKDLAKRIQQMELENQLRERTVESEKNELRRTLLTLQEKVKEEEENNKEMQETLRRKYKEKSELYKKKIEDYKAKLADIIQQKRSHDQGHLLNTIQQLERKIVQLMQDSQKKMAEFRNTKDKERFEIEKKHEYQLREFQNHYEQLLQNKARQLEQQAENYLEEMKTLEQEYRQYLDQKIEDYEHNHIRRRDYDVLIQDKKDRLEKLSIQLEAKDRHVKELQEKLGNSESVRLRLEEQVEEAKMRLDDHDHIMNELKNRRMEMQSQLEAQKSKQKKLKQAILQLEEALRAKDEECQEKSKSVTKYIQLETNYKSEIQELMARNSQLKQQVKEYENKVRESVQQELQTRKTQAEAELQYSQNTSKIEFEYKQEIRKVQFQTDSLQAEAANLKGTIERNLQTISALELEVLQSKEKIGELASLNKKMHEECEFWKQESTKQETKLSGEQADFLAKEKEFEDLARRLEEELVKRNSQIEGLGQEVVECREQEQKYIRTINRLNKVLGSSLFNSLNKELGSLKSYVVSMSKLYENESSVWMHTLMREFEDTLKKKELEHLMEKQAIKEELNRETEKSFSTLRHKYESQNSEILNEREHESTLLKNTLAAKAQELEGVYVQLDKLSHQLHEVDSKLRKTESQLRESENEKDSLRQAVTEIMSSFKIEKEELLKDIYQRSQEYQVELRDLHGLLKLLKKESETLKDSVEQGRARSSRELESSRERETELAHALKIKTEQLSILNENQQSLATQNKKLSAQVEQLQSELSAASNEKLLFSTRLKQVESEKNITGTELEELKKQLKGYEQKQEELVADIKGLREAKLRLQSEANEMRMIVGRTVKNVDDEGLRLAKMLDNETKQLTSKVRELKRLNTYIGQKESVFLR